MLVSSGTTLGQPLPGCDQELSAADVGPAPAQTRRPGGATRVTVPPDLSDPLGPGDHRGRRGGSGSGPVRRSGTSVGSWKNSRGDSRTGGPRSRIPRSEYDGAVVAADAASGKALWRIRATGYGDGGGLGRRQLRHAPHPRRTGRARSTRRTTWRTGIVRDCTKLADDVDSGFEPPLNSVALEGDDVVDARPADHGRDGGRFDPMDGDESWHRAVATTTASVRVDYGGAMEAVSLFDGEEIETNRTLIQAHGNICGRNRGRRRPTAPRPGRGRTRSPTAGRS